MSMRMIDFSEKFTKINERAYIDLLLETAGKFQFIIMYPK